MAEHSPAPDLGAQDPHLAELYRILARCVGTYQSLALSPQDAAAWLQHVDAQAAQLAAIAAERDQQAALVRQWDERDHEKTVQLARLARERDQARADAADAMLAHGLAVESLRHVEAECKRDLAACEGHRRQRAALEAAARALMACTGGIVCQWGVVGMGAWRDLQEAVANLPAPPEGGA